MFKDMWSNEDGMALIFTLLTFVVLSVLGTAIFSLTVSNVNLTKATTTHESTFYISEAGSNQSLALIKAKVKQLSTHSLSHDAFFSQLNHYVQTEINGEMTTFEPNGGEQPRAEMNVGIGAVAERMVGNYSERTTGYTLESTGEIGAADRTIETRFDISHRIQVASSTGGAPLDYLLYSGSNHQLDLTGGGYFEGDVYAKDVNIRASGTELHGSVISEQSIKISSASKIYGDLVALGGHVNLSSSNNEVTGDIHARDYVMLSDGTDAQSIYSGSYVDLVGANGITGDINAGGYVKLGYGAVTNNIYANGDLDWRGGNIVNGDIHAVGDVGLTSSSSSNISVKGNTYTGGDFRAGAYNNFRFDGSVHAGGDIEIGTDNIIKGDAIAGGDITGQGTVNGLRSSSGTPNVPLAPTAPQLSEHRMDVSAIPLTTFEYGSKKTNINQTITLEPGEYGRVKINGRGPLVLKSGNYYFESLSSVPHTGVKFDITDGPINVFVNGDVAIKTDMEFYVKKGARDVKVDNNFVRTHLDEVKKFAGEIYFETHGSFTLPESTTFIGTVIANQNFTAGHAATLVGAFAVNHGKMDIRDYGPNVYYAPPKTSAGAAHANGTGASTGTGEGEVLPPTAISITSATTEQ
ncbi:hypothetical protein DES38_10388 [Streptohalobacillus salinus]|uniref:DUF7305 domain-containing protein n=1 Tax=Streptohalobacillus salinus TaxID=621096 RepID=A0A2V3WFN8_9BACI|nr:hypothetical protein [Streptohalobacillus salinus]PXW92073.1 hypothetical protein DES38_10388 [Streptohalobacillus salinus]